VAELPLGAQAKLLRVLQDGELERVGAESTQRVDVRLIAATHRPVEQMIERGTFRADLYYRLNIFPITVPPLRERADDIPLLVELLLEKLARRHERPVPILTPGVLDPLLQHSWPGNVRELENLLERALILTPGREPLVLPPEFIVQKMAPAHPARGEADPVHSYEATMRGCIERALLRTSGQIYGPSGAAALLGLKPTTLQSKMRKLRIRRESYAKA
jgi:transcriptional regulator with GAF, ATPase, and Fis domain